MTDSPCPTTTAVEWDQRYRTLADKLPDGTPSAALVTEVGDLPPGTALEIGCGVGADAIWLAGRGWRVTALDVSRVALDRAEARSRQAGIEVDWTCARLEDLALPPNGFDLVTAHYPALLHSPGQDAERALLAAVAPGGTLLVVHHADRTLAQEVADGAARDRPAAAHQPPLHGEHLPADDRGADRGRGEGAAREGRRGQRAALFEPRAARRVVFQYSDSRSQFYLNSN